MSTLKLRDPYESMSGKIQRERQARTRSGRALRYKQEIRTRMQCGDRTKTTPKGLNEKQETTPKGLNEKREPAVASRRRKD